MSEPTKPTSEKIFDILGLLVADPFRRWFIVGYVIFNPDFFVFFFTSQEKFDIFQKYFKLQYCPWLTFFNQYPSAVIWLCYKIASPFLFAVFWCFLYPIFEILYRKYITNIFQNKIKDIKDNNILQTKINELNKSLQTEKGNNKKILYENKNINIIYKNFVQERYLEMLPKINEYIGETILTKEYIRGVFREYTNDRYEHCINDDLANQIKIFFGYKNNEFLYINVDMASEITSETKCLTYLKLITLNTKLTQDIADIHEKHLIFLVEVMYRLYQLKNTPNDKI